MTIIRRFPITYEGHVRDFTKIFLSETYNERNYIGELEDLFKTKLGRKYAISCSFGLHALYIVLKFYKLDTLGEILIPGYTALVVKKLLEEMGVRFRVVDIDLDTATMSYADFERKISSETRAVLVTHLLGNRCDEKIMKKAREMGMVIIEDCAHRFDFNREKLNSHISDASFYSFSYSKFINSYTGGMLLTNDPALIEFAEYDLKNRPALKRTTMLRKFILGHVENIFAVESIAKLITPLLKRPELLKKLKEVVNRFTRKKMTNFSQFSNLQAYIALRQIEHLPEVLQKRRDFAEFVIQNSGIRALKRESCDEYYNFIGIFKNAENVHRELLNRGIDSGIRSSIMENIGNDLPECQKAYEHYVLLPNYHTLNRDQLNYMSSCLKEINQKEMCCE